MIDNVLLYRWGANTEQVLAKNICGLGYQCFELQQKIQDYHADGEFAQNLMLSIEKNKIQAVISWDYFPVISSVCQIKNIPYISWIYDCPLYTLLSKTVLNQCNYIFCFDRVYAERIAAMGCDGIYYLPLAVDTNVFQTSTNSHYQSDISFVGSLYSEKDKWLNSDKIPEYMRGYIEGIKEAQARIYGYNFVKEMVTEEVADTILKAIDVRMSDYYFDFPRQMVTDMINKEITEKERGMVIDRLTENFKVSLYTNSNCAEKHNLNLCGVVDYQKTMPQVFYNSKINLNITSKSIESGIPLRILDILACKGFCVTNYQPEVAELFVDGEELVMYTDLGDLYEKVSWYLQHDSERIKIAQAGFQKVAEEFCLRNKLAEIFHIVEQKIS